MIHSYEHTTYFREAEQDGYIGARGYFGYFQDGVTGLLNLVDKGNVTLVEKYRAPWILLRYRMHFVREIGYDHRVRVESWCEKRPSKRTLWLDTTISVEGEPVAFGRLEACVFDLDTMRPALMDFIDFPYEMEEDRDPVSVSFERLPKKSDGMREVYAAPVRYTDLDKTRHMNNLLYVNRFLDAFDADFYDAWRPTDMEVHFLSQCYEGERVGIWEKTDEANPRRHILLATHEDGQPAAQCALYVEPRHR